MRSSDNKFFAIKQLQYLRSCCRNAVSVMKYTCFLGANNHRLVVGACDPATVGEYLVPALSERQDRSQLVVATTSTRQPQFSPRPPPPPPTLQRSQPSLCAKALSSSMSKPSKQNMSGWTPRSVAAAHCSWPQHSHNLYYCNHRRSLDADTASGSMSKHHHLTSNWASLLFVTAGRWS